MTPAPESERELMLRVQSLAGLRLREIAQTLQIAVPEHSRHAKGWAGQLIEMALGATAGSRPVPDFERLGVELKTIPIDASGKPRESTYVTTVPLVSHDVPLWRTSALRAKLQRVLWVPVVTDPALAPGDRRVGTALLWSPDEAEEAALAADYEELMDMICLGQVEALTAHHGTYLQVRPKAADSHARREASGEDGERIWTSPRGFYLRPSFTGELLRRHFLMPGGADCPS